jgi:hypothetical protein
MLDPTAAPPIVDYGKKVRLVSGSVLAAESIEAYSELS